VLTDRNFPVIKQNWRQIRRLADCCRGEPLWLIFMLTCWTGLI